MVTSTTPPISGTYRSSWVSQSSTQPLTPIAAAASTSAPTHGQSRREAGRAEAGRPAPVRAASPGADASPRPSISPSAASGTVARGRRTPAPALKPTTAPRMAIIVLANTATSVSSFPSQAPNRVPSVPAAQAAPANAPLTQPTPPSTANAISRIELNGENVMPP